MDKLCYYQFDDINGVMRLAEIQERTGAHLVQGIVPLIEGFHATLSEINANPHTLHECRGVTIDGKGLKEYRLASDKLSPISRQLSAYSVGIILSIWEQMKDIVALVKGLPRGKNFKEHELFQVGPIISEKDIYWAYGVHVASNYIRHRCDWPTPTAISNVGDPVKPPINWDKYMCELTPDVKRNIQTLMELGFDKLFLFHQSNLTPSLVRLLELSEINQTASKIDEWKVAVIDKVSKASNVETV